MFVHSTCCRNNGNAFSILSYHQRRLSIGNQARLLVGYSVGTKVQRGNTPWKTKLEFWRPSPMCVPSWFPDHTVLYTHTKFLAFPWASGGVVCGPAFCTVMIINRFYFSSSFTRKFDIRMYITYMFPILWDKLTKKNKKKTLD